MIWIIAGSVEENYCESCTEYGTHESADVTSSGSSNWPVTVDAWKVHATVWLSVGTHRRHCSEEQLFPAVKKQAYGTRCVLLVTSGGKLFCCNVSVRYVSFTHRSGSNQTEEQVQSLSWRLVCGSGVYALTK
jgi:hypothetical protein